MNANSQVSIPLFSWAIARERVTGPQVAVIALSVAGALWIVARGNLATLVAFAFHSGDLWMLVAVTDWAIYSVLLRYRPAEIPPLAFLAATIFFGLVVLTPFWLWEVSTGAVMPASLPAAGAVLYVALFASLLAFICWNRSVALRSEERRVGKGGGRTCRSWWSPSD